jgi:hypothetical protein
MRWSGPGQSRCRARAAVAAMVDRLTFNAHILETGTQSYRLAASKRTTRRA